MVVHYPFMKTQYEMLAHDADAMTTVARVRVYDGDDNPNTQMLGFNCRAEEFLDIDMIADCIASTGREVGTPEPRSSVEKPFVTEAFWVSPPLDAGAMKQLGRQLVEGMFLRDADNALEGMMLIDNSGNQLPDHPLDTGKEVVEKTEPRLARVS